MAQVIIILSNCLFRSRFDPSDDIILILFIWRLFKFSWANLANSGMISIVVICLASLDNIADWYPEPVPISRIDSDFLGLSNCVIMATI